MKFKTFDVPTKRVSIKEWGIETNHEGGSPQAIDFVCVRELTVNEFAKFNELYYGPLEDDRKHLRMALVVVEFALDADGQRIFSSDNLGQIAAASCIPAQRIVAELVRLNMHFEAEEELEKN